MLFELDKEIKNKEKIHISIEQTQNKNVSNTYILYAKNNLGNELGFAAFIMEKKFGYIMNIIVKDQKYLHSGLGSIMLNCIEDFLFLNNVKNVSGSFVPEINEEQGYTYESAYNFYIKHGYEFDDDYFYGISISKKLHNLNYSNSNILIENKYPPA